MMISLGDIPDQQTTIDPALQKALEYLRHTTPLRPGETATYFRFWMASGTYQGVSPTQSLIFVSIVQHYLMTAHLAFTFFSCSDPEFWNPVLSYADLHRLPELDFTQEGKKFGVFGYDWRVISPTAWLTLLAEKEINLSPEMPVNIPIEPVIVLSRPDFESAVKSALRHLNAPQQLMSNPLLRSRLIADNRKAVPEGNSRIEILMQLLHQAVESLKDFPRDEKLYQVLYRTFIKPAASQERAAELLGLPFSTYRRHLKAAVSKITEILWQREIMGPLK